MVVVTGALSCADDPTVLDRAPLEVRQLARSALEADVPAQYEFSYEPRRSSPVWCLVGLEAVNGFVDEVVDVAAFFPRGRDGAVVSGAQGLLISSDLLSEWSQPQRWARVQLGADPDPRAVRRLAGTLGPALAGLVAAGAWPTPPNDLVAEAIASAASISSVPDGSGRTGMRIEIDRERYQAEVTGLRLDGSDDRTATPPVVEAWITEGLVDRLVVTTGPLDGSAAGETAGGGFSMEFRYGPVTPIALPPPSDVALVTPEELPSRAVPPPCRLDL